MNNLKTFEGFNIFNSKHDKYLEEILDTIKDTFDSNNLSYDEDVSAKSGITTKGYEYRMEETDSPLGYINIIVRYTGPSLVSSFILIVNNEDIDCSYMMARKFYNFFKSMWKIKENEKKQATISKLKGYGE